MPAQSRHDPVLYLLSRTPQGATASAPQLPAQLGEGSHPPSVPKPALQRPSVPHHGSGASGRLQPGWSRAGRTDSDPMRVQSPGAQPSHAQLPYGAGQDRRAPRHGAGGTADHPSPCRIPPPHGRRSVSPSRQGDCPTLLWQSPRDATAHGGSGRGSPQFIPSSWGKRQRSHAAFSAASNQEPGGHLPLPSPQPNADEQLAGAPLPSPGSHARPAERVCMAQTFSPCKVSFQAGIPPAFGFT